MKVEQINTISWILLVLLTISGFLISEQSVAIGLVPLLLILGATSIKYLTVGFQFLDLKHAHTGWKIIFIALVTLFLLVIFFLRMAS